MVLFASRGEWKIEVTRWVRELVKSEVKHDTLVQTSKVSKAETDR